MIPIESASEYDFKLINLGINGKRKIYERNPNPIGCCDNPIIKAERITGKYLRILPIISLCLKILEEL